MSEQSHPTSKKLVSRLRAYCGHLRQAPNCLHCESADEIERLEHLLEDARLVSDRWAAEAVALRAAHEPFSRRRPSLDESNAWQAAEDERDWWRDYALELEERHAPPPRVGRTNEDYAIEHGRYLATAAEQFLSAVEKLDEAEIAKAEAVTSEEDDGAEIALRDASESRSDHWQALRSAIYEFRKRADRATATKSAGTT